MFVLWWRIVETKKKPVITKKKTTTTSKNKTKMTTKNNIKTKNPAHSLSKDHQAKTLLNCYAYSSFF